MYCKNIKAVSKGKNYNKHAKTQNKFITDFQFPASRQAGLSRGALAMREKNSLLRQFSGVLPGTKNLKRHDW
ncbi:MAG: hypothetical protein ABSE72_01965 [Bacteroidales bacterium]|jgi:hypothetical protein